jgi:hypothetical protein
MKWIFLTSLLLSANFTFAQDSKVIPAFLEAADSYQNGHKDLLTLRPEVKSIIDVFVDNQVDPSILENFYPQKAQWTLPEDDQYDQWIKNAQNIKQEAVTTPPISFQVTKVDVVNSSDLSDDVYAYFFVTDGIMPTGKVSSIYKGISSGESFFFNTIDRAIFPLSGISAKSPRSHLIIDYGIIESDGDDITELQKLSSIIIDIAIAVYSTQSPSTGAIAAKLRKEIKALANLVINQNNDDRLVTSSIGLQNKEINQLIEGKTFHDFKKNHKFDSFFHSWEYNVHFRILK